MTASSHSLATLKESLEKIKELETKFADAKWNQNLSPTAVAEFQTSLLERYHQAKSLYLQRRMEKILVDHVATYDPATKMCEVPIVPGSESGIETDVGLEAQHAQALASLETTVQSVHSKLSHMRNTYQAICSRRQELEKMVTDIEDANVNDEDDIMETDETNSAIPKEQDIAAEQRKIEELQQRKLELQETLDHLRKEKEERLRRISVHESEVTLLRQEQERMKLAGQDPEQFRQKIQELKEMKEFYDSLRGVLEELGGVKIDHVKEDKENRHLFLKVILYESYGVEIELEVYCKHFLKLVNAKWLTSPEVSSGSFIKDDLEPFSMPLSSLDDLVEAAKSSMCPPHDVRFLIRESCARVRIMQSRVEDLAILRQRVLTKVIGNDQVACSLNEGIVIVMRLYDEWATVEQIVGVNGWDEDVLQKIKSMIPDKDESLKPSAVVELVQGEIQRMQQQEGFVIPMTPILPRRKDVTDDVDEGGKDIHEDDVEGGNDTYQDLQN